MSEVVSFLSCIQRLPILVCKHRLRERDVRVAIDSKGRNMKAREKQSACVVIDVHVLDAQSFPYSMQTHPLLSPLTAPHRLSFAHTHNKVTPSRLLIACLVRITFRWLTLVAVVEVLRQNGHLMLGMVN